MAKNIKYREDIDVFTCELLSLASIATAFAVLIPVDILVTLLGVVNILMGNVDVGIIIIVISNLVAIVLCIVAFVMLMSKIK